MGKSDAESIATTVKRASEIPDDTGLGANADVPQLFAQFPIPQGEDVIDNLAAPDGKNIRGIPRYNFRAHFKRFIMGQVEVGHDERGRPEFVERDDSTHYEQLMNEVLDGDAIMRWEERTTLRDGTIVISVSYLTPKPKKKTGDAPS
jgi:hypothetical protein